jgi:hypothetical protein
VSKKDNPNIGMFSSSGARARDADFVATGTRPDDARPAYDRPSYDRPAFDRNVAAPEERKEASKPIFTSSKKKTLVGGDQVETIQSSKQNYDFSTFKTAAATDKVSTKPVEG